MAQTVDLWQVIFINHPNVVFPAISSVLAFLALSPTPSFVPLTALVATLLVYTRIVVPRRHAPRTIFGAICGVSLASTISHAFPSIHALSSTTASIISLWIISSLASVVAFGIVTLSNYLSLRLNNPWAKITLFPALWATAWQAISHTSPVGHLVTWSPVTGIASYEWMRPFFGAWGMNWIVGAWAIVIAELVGGWFIGPEDEFDAPGPLVSLVTNGEPEPGQPTTFPSPRQTLLLGTALLVLTTPSFFLPTIPTLPWSSSSTPLPIGCILPHPSSPGDGSTPLDRFIVESRHHNGARILLWPEGALRFETVSQREEAIQRVQNEIKGPLVGVTFTEPVPPSAEWSHSRDGKWRNGLVLVGPDGPVAEFYKRNLVPCMCSSIRTSIATHIILPLQMQNLSLSLNPGMIQRSMSLNSMGPTRTGSGHRSPHMTGLFPSQLRFVWTFPARQYSHHWIRARHLSSHLHRPGTATSARRCGNKLGHVQRRQEAWCYSATVAPKVQVVSLAMAYENLSNLDPDLGHAPSA